MHTVRTLVNAFQEAVSEADCSRTARTYQNPGYGPPGGEENLCRGHCCHEEQENPQLLPSVSC
jgi:hypothetical protein